MLIWACEMSYHCDRISLKTVFCNKQAELTQVKQAYNKNNN